MGSLIAERFELGEFIAQGGMGAVYRGLDRQTGQIVAIKSVRPELVDAALIARFQQEGETLRTLNHPNIVKLVAAVQDGDQHYLIMEYVSGGSLADLLAKQSSLSADQTVTIALELADALTRAHHLKIIHRDLKPANVLLADDGTPRLTDFGVARTADGNLTGTGVIVGTLSYLAPEILNGEPADARADIWAFGVTLFELLTGRLPFRADSPAVLITAILTQPTPDLELLRPDLPVALVDLIYRMLDKDPRQRIGSMRQIAAELESLYKNGTDTERLSRYKVTVDSDESSLLSLPTPTPAHDNLPVQTTPFIGREAELVELAKMIADRGTRLITILGPGGMGKTRLALEAASAQLQKFADGVYFVSLAPISDPESILSVTAEAVGFQFYAGDTPPRQQLLNFFREKAMLVVFDNFEHVLTAKTFLTDILNTARNVKLLATSRERLNLQSETLFRIEGMDFPDWETPEDAVEYSAVKLFLQSARRVEPSFELTSGNVKYLARICRLVQGMPLGILLAAAWVDQLTLAEIADEIAHNVDFLETEQGDVPQRQRSIQAVFDYSWNLLSTDERSAFRQMSVFRGGFTREAAQAVTGASLKTLADLVNKSVLRRNTNGRYEVHELLRQYAVKLAPDVGSIEKRHSQYYLQLLAGQELLLKGGDQLGALRLIEIDIENIHVAWNYAVAHEDVAPLGSSWRTFTLYLIYKNHEYELITIFNTVIKRFLPTGPTAHHAILYACALSLRAFGLSVNQYSPELSVEQENAFAILRKLEANQELMFITIWLASPDLDTIREVAQATLSIAQSLDDNWATAYCYHQLAYSALSDPTDKMRFFAQKEAGYALSSGNYFLYASALETLGWTHYYVGEYPQTIELVRQVHALYVRLERPPSVESYRLLSATFRKMTDFPNALQSATEAVRLARSTGNQLLLAFALNCISEVYAAIGSYEDAKGYILEAMNLANLVSHPWLISSSFHMMTDLAIRFNFLDIAEQFVYKALRLEIQRQKNVRLIEVSKYALIQAKRGYLQRAVELLSLCMAFPLSRFDYQSGFQSYLSEIRPLLSQNEFTAAVEHGKALNLDMVVAEILAEPPLFAPKPSDNQ